MTALVILVMLIALTVFWVRGMYPEDSWVVIIFMVFGMWMFGFIFLMLVAAPLGLPMHKIVYLI